MRRVVLAVLAVVVVAAVVAVAGLFFASPSLLARGGFALAQSRLVTGILVTGTAERPVLYVSSSDPRIGGDDPGTDTGLDTNSGVISRLTLTGSDWQRLDLVRGLPRSERDHGTNGLALDPSGSVLYVAQGGNTNKGAPSHRFAETPEYALSGAILAVDLRRIGETTYDLPTLDDDTRGGPGDAGDPFGGNDGKNQARLVPGGPVTIFAPGYRNPYDVVVTSAGRIYTVQNGAGFAWGGTPHREGPAGNCTNEPHDGGAYDPDTLHLVRRGIYAGHPNPTRGNTANRFNRDGQTPVPAADPIQCDYIASQEREAIAIFPLSTNGLAEYTASSLGGSLRGDLVAASFDRNVYRVKLTPDGTGLVRRDAIGTLGSPLDVTAQGDDDVFPGTIWVAEYTTGLFEGRYGEGGNLGVLEPDPTARRDSGRPAFRSGVLRGSTATNPTSLQFGPDGRLYVAQQNGLIKAYTIERRRPGDYRVTATETITAIQAIPNHNDDGTSATSAGSLLRAVRDRLGL